MVSTRPIDLLMGLSLVLHRRSWYSTEESEKLIWLVTNSNTETSIFNFVSLKLAISIKLTMGGGRKVYFLFQILMVRALGF